MSFFAGKEMSNIIDFTLNSIQENIYWVDTEANIINVNAATTSRLGYSKKEMIGKSIFEINPTLNKIIFNQILLNLRKEKHQLIETYHQTKDAQTFPVQVSANYIQLKGQEYIFVIAKDITNNNRYRQLFEITEEIAKIGAWDWNMDTNEILNTKEVLNIYDLGEGEELYPEIGFTAFKGDALDKLQNAMEKARLEGLPFDMTLDFTSFKNVAKKIYISAAPKIFNGRVQKIQGIFRDVTAEFKAQQEMYLKDFTVENTADMVAWANTKGRFVFANNATIQNLRFTKEEILDLHVWDIVVDYPKDKWMANLERLKEIKQVRFPTTHRRKDGSTYPTDTILHYIKFENKEYVCAIVRNEEAMEAMKEQLHFTQYAIDISNDMILWLDHEGYIIYANESLCKRLGYTKDELKAFHIEDIDKKHTKESYQKVWNNIIKKDKSRSIETVMLTKDKKELTFEVNANYIQFNGKEYNYAFARDVTKRKANELQLQQSIKENEKLREQLEAEKDYLQKEIHLQHNFDEIISSSKKYKAILSQVEEVAPTDTTVLITGETGTGKELIARALHSLSLRSKRALIKINCAVLPENLIESELFGHERGAFTGAIQTKIGRFELASGATIFLDEIGELPLELQAKLLRVLQEGEFSRLGSNKILQTDVRIIAATNRNLDKQVQKGKFRQDLFYRLNVFPIANIPLRERKEDIMLLTQHFMEKFNEKIGKNITTISKASAKKLTSYDFPGNIRELENIIERAVILSKGKSLTLNHWFPSKQNTASSKSFKTLEELQKDHIIKALKKTNWKVSGVGGAAELLGLKDKTLDSKMRKLDIHRRDFMV